MQRLIDRLKENGQEVSEDKLKELEQLQGQYNNFKKSQKREEHYHKYKFYELKQLNKKRKKLLKNLPEGEYSLEKINYDTIEDQELAEKLKGLDQKIIYVKVS